MINDENWQSRISQKKSGSFNNDQNVYFLAVFKFFVKFFDFSRTNWYYMLKGIIKSYHSWKNEQICWCGSKNIEYGRFSGFWIIQKFFFEKNFFSTQNRSIRVKNMFSRFSIFFLSNSPRLSHFLTKKWNFRFWPCLAILA